MMVIKIDDCFRIILNEMKEYLENEIAECLEEERSDVSFKLIVEIAIIVAYENMQNKKIKK